MALYRVQRTINGQADATHKPATMHLDGVGVLRDPVNELRWLTRSSVRAICARAL